MNVPRPHPLWTMGTAAAAVLALLSILGMLANLEWGYAAVSERVNTIPVIQAQQQKNTNDIGKLQIRQDNSDSRFNEILAQLARLNDKLDHQAEVAAHR